MDKSEGVDLSSVSGESQAATSSWITKEDDRARRENGIDQAQGHHFVWTLLLYLVLPAIVALGAFLLRRVG